MTTIEPNVLSRIIKLLRKADSTKELGNAAEAAAFAAKANEMLMKYKLSRDELELLDEPEANPIGVGDAINPAYDTDAGKGGNRIGSGKRAKWFEDLAGAVCEFNFCRLLLHPNYKSVWVVGRKHDREVAEYLIKTLTNTAWRLATAYYYQSRKEAKDAGLPMPKEPKKSFLIGFSVGIYEALYEQRRKQGNNPNAVVLVKKSQEEVNQYVDDLNKPNAKDLEEQVDPVSLWKGFEAGKQATVGGGLKGSDDGPESLKKLLRF